MEQDNKKRRTGQNIAFYTALAVCLIAVGVGTWELLQPEKASNDAAAVSSAVALPDGGAASGDDGGATLWEGGGVGPEDVSGDGAEIPASGAADIPQSADSGAASAAGESATASDASAAENSEAVTGAASVPAAGKSATGDAKSSAKSDGGAKSTTDAKSGKTEAKSKDSVAKANQSDAKSKSDGKADAAKPSGKATRPVEGETVTSFSMDKLLYNETMRDWRTHDGIDIAADAGTAVVAARPGTVETVEADPIMGTTVTVRHEGKWESVYASLADMAEVEAGDEVSAGQVLGFVGETAASESALGPHLHFSVLNDGTPVDPETFLA